IEIKKHPSPLVKPANQLGSLTLLSKSIGLAIGVTLGKVSFNSSDKPRLIEALMLSILLNPSLVRC
ncbi:hypothetical protein K445DRAFT_40564, partial [Daldinia sp. EC12]